MKRLVFCLLSVILTSFWSGRKVSLAFRAFAQAEQSPVPTKTLRGAGEVQQSARPQHKPIPILVNAWTTFQTGGFPAEIVGYDATVYAQAIKRHIVLGKYHHYSSEPNYCMDGWSWDENRWDILDCGAYFHTEHSMEGGHPVGAFVYMPMRQSIVYWGGQSGSNQPEQALHTWWWDVRGRTGRDKLGRSRPGLARVSAMAYDQSRDKVLFYPDALFRAEIYDPANNNWTIPVTSGTSPPRGLIFPTLDWNSKDRKTYLFGGALGNNCNSGLTFSNNVYTFDIGSNKWSKLIIAPDPVNGAPQPRWFAGFAYDPSDNIFLLAGGQYCKDKNAASLTDTWKFDPAAMRWTKMNPSSVYKPREGDAPFQKLRYDPDHNAFVMFLLSYDHHASTNGTWGNYPARVWVYCYTGTCASVGNASESYAPPAASLNRNEGRPITSTDQTWASDTAIASDGHTIYAGWIETGLPFSSGVCHFHHPYVQSDDGALWSLLGSDCVAMDSRAATVERDAEKLSLAVVNGTPWASWSESNSWAAPPNTIFAKYWNGHAWIGGGIGTRNPALRATQGFSQLLSVAGVPTIAFIENNRSIFPDITEAYIDQLREGIWVPLGGKLNTSSSSRVESLSITSDGRSPWACWTQELMSGWTSVAPSQLHCSHWSGSKWTQPTMELNNKKENFAAEASIAYLSGRIWIAWTERTTSGNARLYVKALDTSTQSVGKSWSLNNDISNGWAFHPRLVTDGRKLFLSWEEQLALGQPSRLYVSRWDGESWSRLGSQLNADAEKGTVSHSSITIINQRPVVIWNEVEIGQLQQTYTKSWNGSQWIRFVAPSSGGPVRPSGVKP